MRQDGTSQRPRWDLDEASVSPLFLWSFAQFLDRGMHPGVQQHPLEYTVSQGVPISPYQAGPRISLIGGSSCTCVSVAVEKGCFVSLAWIARPWICTCALYSASP